MNYVAKAKRIIAPFYLSLKYALGGAETRTVSGLTCRFPSSEALFPRNFDAEAEAIRLWLSEICPGDVVWDVGSDRGIYSIMSCLRYTDVSAVAFEPHPITAIRMKKILAMNGVAERTRIVNAALGEESSRGSLEGYRVRTQEGDGVRVLRGADVIDDRSISPPDALKIDVEGMELEVLRGLEPVLHEKPPRVILCELHPEEIIPTGLTEEEVLELRRRLTRHGYDISQIDKEEHRRGLQSLFLAKRQQDQTD